MAASILGTLVFFVYVLTVAISPVLAVATVLLSRRRTETAALGSVIGAVAGVVTLGATVGLALLSWQAGVVLFLAGQGSLAVLVVAPLLVGRTIVRQATGVARETALRIAVTVWPLALAGSYALFVAPGGFTVSGHSNLTDLAGGAAGLGWTGWVVLVLFGPGVLGAVGVTVWRRVT